MVGITTNNKRCQGRMALPTSLKELKNAIAKGHALLATSTISMAIENAKGHAL